MGPSRLSLGTGPSGAAPTRERPALEFAVKREAELLDIFAGLHWVLEAETVCRLVQSAAGAMCLVADGTQVWRNPRFTSAQMT